ncbi:DsbA family protein [Paenibacillus sp. M1]|uniref:DsbA family protein n=1 Tax=Paenibacillus haidiansis TaxID=1574488 RepID=A0ABU7VMP2_9BACL
MPPKKQTNALAQRKSAKEQLVQQQRKRRLIWFSTVGVLLVLIIVVLSLDPKPVVKAASFDYENLPMLGQSDAPVKIVEFGDFKCPSCKIANDTIKPQLVSDYIDQGKVAFYFMNLPFLGADSTTAALAVQSVYHQNKDAFWTYFDAIYDNQGDEQTEWATADLLVGLAEEIGLEVDYDLLRSDIENKTYLNEVNEQYGKANDLKITGTPTFYIDGVQYTGSFADYSEFKQAVEDALKN